MPEVTQPTRWPEQNWSPVPVWPLSPLFHRGWGFCNWANPPPSTMTDAPKHWIKEKGSLNWYFTHWGPTPWAFILCLHTPVFPLPGLCFLLLTKRANLLLGKLPETGPAPKAHPGHRGDGWGRGGSRTVRGARHGGKERPFLMGLQGARLWAL